MMAATTAMSIHTAGHRFRHMYILHMAKGIRIGEAEIRIGMTGTRIGATEIHICVTEIRIGVTEIRIGVTGTRSGTPESRIGATGMATVCRTGVTGSRIILSVVSSSFHEFSLRHRNASTVTRSLNMDRHVFPHERL
jgi:hypothetical protein